MASPDDRTPTRKSREGTNKVHHTTAPQRVGIRRRASAPSHALAPVLKYKAKGVKRTISQKYSTNISMEATGRWAGLLPSEGRGCCMEHILLACSSPAYQGVDAASAPGVGRGEEMG